MQLWRRLTRANTFSSSIRAISPTITKRTMTAPLCTSKANSPYNFILDFDGTITTHDTIFTVANIALSIQHQKYGQDLSQKWSDCVSAYTENYTQHVKTQIQIQTQTKNHQNQERNARDSIAGEISFQRSLKEVEDRSFIRVGESGLFKGISGLELEKAGSEAVKNRDVVIRNGFKDFIARVQGGRGGGGGGRWGVLSVNFIQDFIRGVVGCALGGDDDQKEEEQEDKKEGREGREEEEILVVANNSDVKTGFLSGPEFGQEGRLLLTTSADKMVFMNRIFGGEGWRGRGVIYIGDSGTDLECLLEADVGIVVTDGEGRSKLLDRLRELGTEVENIGMYQAGHRKCLYWAKDYGEILKVEELFDVKLGS